ncbi:MAG: tetratricopeptide repeat protein [candidate division Zixibacteria bacterium]|nr:tetratricopeptide repeat protein [candidate division Zixibacteria bacterium]
MGLITKAIDKVDKDQSPPAQEETASPPKRKRKILLAAVTLLLAGTCLGLGYLFLLQRTAEVPPRVARRSMSVKKSPPKRAPKQAEVKGTAGLKGREMIEEKTASEETPKETLPQKHPDKESATAGKEMKPAAPEEESSGRTALDRTSGVQSVPEPTKSSIEIIQEEPEQEPEIAESPVDKLEEPEDPSAAEKEENIPAGVAASDDIEETPGELSGKAVPALPEQIPSEEVSPSYLEEPEREWTQKQLAVTERSDSRAKRYYKKGVSYHQQGELNRAIDSYREALVCDPDHLPAHKNLATAYLQTGRFWEAEQELVYLYALRPRDPRTLFNFGLLLYRIGEHVSAEIKLRRLLELEPLHLEANLLLGSIYEKKGDTDQALEFCIRAYQINSADPRVLYRLGRAWDMAGEPAKAVKYYQLFIKTHSPKEDELEPAVRDRLKYLINRKE